MFLLKMYTKPLNTLILFAAPPYALYNVAMYPCSVPDASLCPMPCFSALFAFFLTALVGTPSR